MSKLKTAMVLLLICTIDVSGLALDTLSTRATNILARDVSVDAPYRDPNSAPDAKHGESMHQGSRLRRQVFLSGCVMPYSTPNGTYSLRSPLKIEGGQLAPYNSIIDLKCPPGFISPKNSATFCDAETNGWYEELRPCQRMCKRPQSLTVDFTCSVLGRDGELQRGPCDATIPSGSTAFAKCRDGYHSITNSRSITCLDGQWGYDMPSCTAECGKVTPQGTINILNGNDSVRGEFPWHVAIYSLYGQEGTNLSPKYFCGGSIITSTIVISAAHCFYDPIKRKALPVNLFKAAVGKIYSDFTHPEEATNAFIQKFDVKKIEIPEDYEGVLSSYMYDLALVILEKPIVFSTIIMPVCLNLIDEDFDEKQSFVGQRAKVAGFGLTGRSEIGVPSDNLKTAEMPIVPKDKCKMELPRSFIKYVTPDKLCAGQTTGVGICTGDSGGGLVVSSSERYELIWHLRGVISISPLSGIFSRCSENTYSLYTKPFFHKEFIKQVIERQGCEMPSNPPNGKFILAELKNASAGEGVPHRSQVTLQCDPGFIPSDYEDNICDEFTNDWIRDIAECINGIAISTERPPQMVGCVMPYSTPNRTYSLLGPINKEGGQLVPYGSIVEWKCPLGFSNSRNGTTFCDAEKNDWHGELGTCQRMCKRPQSSTVDFTCLVRRDGEIYKGPCDATIPSGSTASPKCRNGYHSMTNSKFITCDNGQWVYAMPSCTAECGKVTPQATPQIINGKPAVRGEFPWHVAIYSQYGQEGRNSAPAYSCGGSIITGTIAISAAHCFYDSHAKKKQSAKLFKVAVGKIYSDFDHPDESTDEFIQKFDVKRIEIPEDYQGIITSFSHDLALVILEKPIVFSDIIMPVCLNLSDDDFEELQTSAGQQAKIAGFGLTNVMGNASYDLKTAIMPIVTKLQCKEGSPDSFSKFIISDKLCAGQTTEDPKKHSSLNVGVGVCKGDSGGGLVVKSFERYDPIWHLRGIVSSSPKSSVINELCDANTYSVYTKPYSHKLFIENVIESQGCEMPSNPPNGKFVLVAFENVSPGEGVRHKSRMTLQCDPGFIPSDYENNVCDEYINDWIKDFAKCVPKVTASTSPTQPLPQMFVFDQMCKCI